MRLIGIVLGSWLLKYGAVAASLSSIALLSITIPILGFLPYSVAQAPGKSSSDLFKQPDSRSQNIKLRRLLPTTPSDQSDVAKAELIPEDGHGAGHENRGGHLGTRRINRSKSWTAFLRERGYAGYAKNWTHSSICNPLCVKYLAIVFTNTLAMDFRNQLKPWVSTRYGWPLATVGYVLSIESLAGVAVLFALPWLDRIWRRSSTTAARTFDAPAKVKDSGRDQKRKHELRVAKASLLFGAMGAIIVALAADRAFFVVGILTLTGAVGFPDAVRAFCTSFFATSDIQPLYAAVTVVEMLGGIVASPIWGWIFAQAYHGGGYWMGIPLVVCAVLLLSILGLLSRLRP